MAITVSATTETSRTAAGTTHPFTYTQTTGHAVIILVATNTDVSITAMSDSFSDISASTGSLHVIAKVLDGSEGGSTNITFSSAVKCAAVAYNLTGFFDTFSSALELSAPVTGTEGVNGTAPNSDSLSSSWLGEDTLWVTFFQQNGEEADDDTWVTGTPTGFGNLTQVTSGTGGASTSNCQLGSAYKTDSTQTVDPDAFTTAQDRSWEAYTLAIRPASAGVVVTPTTVALVLATFGPTVSTPRLATPGTLALALSTFAPTTRLAITVTPTTSSLTLSPFVPVVSVTAHITVVPSVASLAASGFAPVIQLGITPQTQTLSTSLFAPSVRLGSVVTPSTIGLSTSTFAPSVILGVGVVPGAASLATSLFAPTVSITDHKVVVPGTSGLTTSTFVPVIELRVTPGTAPLVISTFEPTVDTGSVTWCSPGVPFLYTAANWGTVVFAFEAYHRANPNTGRSRLFDKTSSLAVAGSELTTTSTSLVRQRSGALVLTDGHEYEPQFGSTASDHTSVQSARLVVI